MDAIDFGHTSDRDYNRGICMMMTEVGGDEWCAKALTVVNYRGSFKQPRDYGYGALYGIHVPEGIPEHESFWVCDDHRLTFLKSNSITILGTTIWQFNHYGRGKEATWVPLLEASVRIRTHLSEMELSDTLAAGLDSAELIGIESWDYLKVVSV